ncbi:MAG: sigma-70 family RNA polymerase sigma factor [Actinomycetota bacterium]
MQPAVEVLAPPARPQRRSPAADIVPLRRDPRADDRDLVLAFQHGDPRAFQEIYRRHQPHAERVCRRYLNNPDDAEEAAQEAMIRVLRGLPTFNGQYALKAWIHRVATNYCLDLLRARARHASRLHLVGGTEVEASLDPHDVLESQHQSHRVRTALAAMPVHHRKALLLREIEGLSHEEIAVAMGITGPRAKALIHRARKRFRTTWADEPRHASGALLPLLVAGKVPALLRRLLVWIQRLPSAPARAVIESGGGEQLTALGLAIALGAGIAAAPPPITGAGPPSEAAAISAQPAPSPADAAPARPPQASYVTVSGSPAAPDLADHPLSLQPSLDPLPSTSGKPLTIVLPSRTLASPGSPASPAPATEPEVLDVNRVGGGLPWLPLPTDNPSSLLLPPEPLDTTPPGESGEPANANYPGDSQQPGDADVDLPVDANIGLDPEAAVPAPPEDGSTGDILSASLIP